MSPTSGSNFAVTIAESAPSPPSMPSHWEFDVVLADGGTVHIRPIAPTDAERYAALFHRLSAEARYYRFLGPKADLTPAEIERFTTVDFHDRVALAALVGDEMIAVVRYDRVPDGVAEVAVTIDDDQQGRGLGTLMLEYLAAAGREHGVERLVAETLPGDRSMVEMARDAGYQTTDQEADGVIRLDLPLVEVGPDDERHAVERREHLAETRSIDRILRPKSVAVIGASSHQGAIGHQLFLNLLAGEFVGPVYPVNDRAPHVASVAAYPTIADVPGEVDLAVVAVPAAAVPGVVEQCAEKGVKGVVVVSSGFTEPDSAGAVLEQDLLAAARRSAMRIVGPNSLGVANTTIGLNATFAPRRPQAGRVGFVTESGALSIAMLDRAAAVGVGISSFASLGNRADVSANDLLQYWEDDPDTDVVLLYLETFGNPRNFARIARRVAQRTPIVAVRSARPVQGFDRGREPSVAGGSGGSEAARGANAVGGAEVVAPVTVAASRASDALFQQTGVIRVDTLTDLFDVTRILSDQPLPRGERVAIVGNGAGLAPLAAHACVAAGLTMATLASSAIGSIRARPDGPSSAEGVVDLAPAAGATQYAAALQDVLGDDGVDAVIVVHAPPLDGPPDVVAAAVTESVERVAAASDKTVVAAIVAVGGARPAFDGGVDDARRVPVFDSPEPAAIALGRVARYATWRRRQPGEVPVLTDIDRAGARELIAEVLAAGSPDGWLDDAHTSALLGCYGLPFVPTTDGSPAAAPTGVDVAVGLVHDPAFGPLVVFGVGSMPTELLADRAFRILPLTGLDAAELMRSAQASSLLLGASGPAPVAVDQLEEVLVRVGLLAEELPEVTLLDLNPVVVGSEGVVVTSARVRVQPALRTPDDLIRRLRH